MHGISWLLWAVVLFLQNISFTYVSRARSSGSLVRHVKASVFSNGIWIFSQMIMLGPLFDYLTGKHGRIPQIGSATLYTVTCVSGSIFAHWLALKTEKGKDAVGYSKKYAQIPVAEWEAVKAATTPLEGISGSTYIEGFSPAEVEYLRTRILGVDTGDGIGTFTTAEIGKLKELCGTVLETEVTQDDFDVEVLLNRGGTCVNG